MELSVLPHLIATGALCAVDQLLLELHRAEFYAYHPSIGVEVAANFPWSHSFGKGLLYLIVQAAGRANGTSCRLQPGGMTTRSDDETYQNDGQPLPTGSVCDARERVGTYQHNPRRDGFGGIFCECHK